MSTKVTYTMTVTESTLSSPPKLGFNGQALQTKEGILRILELLIEISCLIMMFKGDHQSAVKVAPVAAAILMLCFLSCTFPALLSFISQLISPMSASLIPRMVYEFLNNVVSCLFFILSSMTFLILILNSELVMEDQAIAVGVLGILSGILYFVSAYYSFQVFRPS